jgi:polar amino acid transport system substrate-binding protein
VPYVVNALAIIVERGNPLKVTGYEQLAGQPVGSEIAGFADKLLREQNDAQVAKGMKPMDIRAFNTFAEAFAALAAGQVKAVFGPDATAVYFAQRSRFDIGANGLNPGLPSSFGFDAGNAKLAEAVRAALSAMAADGTYGKMMEAYGAADIKLWDKYDGDFRVFHTPG